MSENGISKKFAIAVLAVTTLGQLAPTAETPFNYGILITIIALVTIMVQGYLDCNRKGVDKKKAE